MEHPSLDSYLGGLASEELLTIARQLEELRTHPGWEVYLGLLEIQRAKSNFQMVHRPMREVSAYAHSGGYIAGLEDSGKRIIDKVTGKARDVEKALEREDREEAWTG